MPLSRFLLFASKNSSRDTPYLIQRCGLLRRFQSSGYKKSTKHNCRKPADTPLVPVKTQGSSSWSTLIVPAAGFLGVIGVAFLVHKNDERRAIKKGQGNCAETRNCTGPIIGGPFSLINTENRLITERDLRGNWVLLYFGYTSSPDVGPEQVRLMAKAIDILESKQNSKLLPVFVSIDPNRDSPSQLDAYLKEFDSRIVGLTGPVANVRQMAQEYRVFFKKIQEDGDDYLVESSHNMYLLNPEMEVVRCFGMEYNAEELAEGILKDMKRTPM